MTLLKRLCLPSAHVTFRLLDQLVILLPEAAAAGAVPLATLLDCLMFCVNSAVLTCAQQDAAL